MDVPKGNIKKEFTYDFFQNKVPLLKIVGYSESRTVPYISYIVSTFIFYFYIQGMSIYAGYLVTPRKVLIIGALHGYLITTFAVWGLSTRLLADRHLQNTNSMLRRGIYSYEDEDIDRNQENTLKTVLSEIKRKSNLFTTIFTIGVLTNMVFFPLSQYMMFEDGVEEEIAELLNPYLPHFYYSPFSHWTWWGFTANYILNLLIFLYVYGTAASMIEIYIACTVQLKAHLQVLNYSIQNIERRAYDRYLRNKNSCKHVLKDDIFEDKEYQRCLYQCLRENIKHHLSLVEFKNEFMYFVGSFILDNLVLGSVIYATILYLIYQRLPVNYVLTLIVTLLCEQTVSFCICVYGQEIIDESNNLYGSLYGIRWMYCDGSFTKALDIMMCYSIKPMKLNAMIVSSPACLETYADIITAVYKLMNLVKHSDDANRI